MEVIGALLAVVGAAIAWAIWDMKRPSKPKQDRGPEKKNRRLREQRGKTEDDWLE